MKEQSRATMSLFGRLGVRGPRKADNFVAARHSMMRVRHYLLPCVRDQKS